jgi:hypothetical protein
MAYQKQNEGQNAQLYGISATSRSYNGFTPCRRKVEGQRRNLVKVKHWHFQSAAVEAGASPNGAAVSKNSVRGNFTMRYHRGKDSYQSSTAKIFIDDKTTS